MSALRKMWDSWWHVHFGKSCSLTEEIVWEIRLYDSRSWGMELERKEARKKICVYWELSNSTLSAYRCVSSYSMLALFLIFLVQVNSNYFARGCSVNEFVTSYTKFGMGQQYFFFIRKCYIWSQDKWIASRWQGQYKEAPVPQLSSHRDLFCPVTK